MIHLYNLSLTHASIRLFICWIFIGNQKTTKKTQLINVFNQQQFLLVNTLYRNSFAKFVLNMKE